MGLLNHTYVERCDRMRVLFINFIYFNINYSFLFFIVIYESRLWADEMKPLVNGQTVVKNGARIKIEHWDVSFLDVNWVRQNKVQWIRRSKRKFYGLKIMRADCSSPVLHTCAKDSIILQIWVLMSHGV